MSHLDPIHYHLIAAVLLGGDVQARVVSNERFTGVEVKTERARIIWGNDGDVWAWTEITPDGAATSGQSDLDAEADPDDVAKMIVTQYQVAED